MAEETKSILMNPDAIAIDQDREPKPVERLSQQGKSEVLVRPLSGNAFAVGLFNRGDQPAEIGFRWDALKFDTGLYGFRRLQVQDLWKHEPAGFRRHLHGHGPEAWRRTAQGFDRQWTRRGFSGVATRGRRRARAAYGGARPPEIDGSSAHYNPPARG